MSLHSFIRFEPQAGKEERLREELRKVVDASRSETGCVSVHLFESVRPAVVFFIYSEWEDEATFEAHAALPHTRHFLLLVPELITHPVQAVRTYLVS